MNFLRRRKRRGQALVEMAIVFPFFLLVVVGGIIDFGFAFYNLLTLQQIADDVAMRAADNSISTGSSSAIIGWANAARPTWWAGQFQVATPQKESLAGFVGETGWRISLTYQSPVYTPFYQVMFGAAGSPNIPLAANAYYKIPLNLLNR